MGTSDTSHGITPAPQTSLLVPSRTDNQRLARRMKHSPHIKALLAVGTIVLLMITAVIIGEFSDAYLPVSSDPESLSIAQSPVPSSFMILEDDPVIVKCENIGKQPDQCKFVTDNCESEGLFNYLKLRYCRLPKNKVLASIIAILILTFALFLYLQLLGQTVDAFLIPSLTTFADQLKLSPAVAGLSLLSLGNGSGDVIVALQSVSKGAKTGDIGLVLGSVSGAALAICVLALGCVILAAKDKSRISRGAFWRSMGGYCVVLSTSIGLCWKGVLRFYDGVILMVLWGVFVFFSATYLQREQIKKNKAHKLERKNTFIRETSYRLSQSKRDLSETLLNGEEDSESFAYGEGSYIAPKITPMSSIEEEEQSPVSKPTLFSSAFTQNQSISNLLSLPGTNRLDDSECELESLSAPPTEKNRTGYADPVQIALAGGDDEDDDEDLTYFMSGLHFPSEWKDPNKNKLKFVYSVLLYGLCFPFSLLRWLTIPSTDHRPDFFIGPKRIAVFISPLPAAAIFGVSFIGTNFKQSLWPWVAVVSVGGFLTAVINLSYHFYVKQAVLKYNKERYDVQLHVESTKDQANLTEEQLHDIAVLVVKWNLDQTNEEHAKPLAMTLFQILVAFIAFLSSIAWLGLIAGEIVEVLQTIGIMFNISESLLGLSVLSLSNSVPDIFSNISLAQGGRKMSMAYSAIFSAPILSGGFGFGLAVLLSTITITPAIRYHVTPLIIVCWSFVLLGMVVVLVGFPLQKMIPKAAFGYALIGIYCTFLISAVITEFVTK